MDEFNINELLNEIEELLKFTLKKIDLDNSRFAKNIKIEYSNDSITVLMPEYAEYIDKGRKKGSKQPPIKAMIDFIRSRNIQSNLTELQLAYAIANSIKRDGIKPKPFIEKLTQEIFNLVELHIFNEVNLKLSKTFKNE